MTLKPIIVKNKTVKKGTHLFNIIKTDNTLSVINRKYIDNGYIIIDVSMGSEIAFNIVSDNILDSYSKVVINDNATTNTDLSGSNDLIAPSVDSLDYSTHPLDHIRYYGSNILNINKFNKENWIICLVQFAIYNKLNVIIQGYSNIYPELDIYLFDNCTELSIMTLKRLYSENTENIYNKIQEILPTWINFDNRMRYLVQNARDTDDGVFVPNTYLEKLGLDIELDNIHPYAFRSSAYYPAGMRITLDGYYTDNCFKDYMIDEYLSYNLGYECLYWDKDRNNFDIISQWSIDNDPDYIPNCDFVYIDRENDWFYTDCVWYDDYRDEYRLNGDYDEIYIHSYKSSDRNLRSPEKFQRGSKFQAGLEVEVEFGYDRDDAAEFLVANYSDSERNFILEEDGSLSDGFEMVTSPFIFNGELPSWLSKSLNYLENETDREFNNCGGHIHIDRNSFINREAIQLFIYLFNSFDSNICLLSGRNCISPSYAESQNGSFDSVLDVHTADNNWYSRYVYVNRQNAATIEVRIFKGCTEKEIIMKRLSMLKHMVEYCNQFVENNADLLEKTSAIDEINWYDFSGLDNQQTRDFNNGYYED